MFLKGAALLGLAPLDTRQWKLTFVLKETIKETIKLNGMNDIAKATKISVYSLIDFAMERKLGGSGQNRMQCRSCLLHIL